MNAGLPLKFGFFSNIFKISMTFSDKSVSELCILFMCVVVVRIFLTYCSLRFSVFSSFILISACSSLSSSFQKSKSGSRIEEGCDALFLIAVFRN